MNWFRNTLNQFLQDGEYHSEYENLCERTGLKNSVLINRFHCRNYLFFIPKNSHASKVQNMNLGHENCCK